MREDNIKFMQNFVVRSLHLLLMAWWKKVPSYCFNSHEVDDSLTFDETFSFECERESES